MCDHLNPRFAALQSGRTFDRADITRAFMPPHLVGRGVTLINLFGIGAAGLLQIVTGRLHGAWADPAVPAAPYAGLFAFYAALVAVGLVAYLWSKDSVR